jgi:hypothetical protein
MRNERAHGTALALFGLAMIVAIVAAAVTTLERVDKRTANSEAAPGTMGLAKARPPLDRAPGQPLTGN